MKKIHAPGEKDVIPRLLKYGNDTLQIILEPLLNGTEQRKIPVGWKNAIIVLLHKEGAKTYLPSNKNTY